jgi:microcystin-dependent protein
MVSSNFSNRPFRLEENVWLRYQDVGGNFSNYGGELWIRKNSYSPSRSGYRSTFSFWLDGGQVAGWDFTFDFTNSDALRLAYVEKNIGHNGDGTKYFGIDGYCDADVLGHAEVHSGLNAPTIPRSSKADFPNGNWRDAGQTFQIRNNRASGNFMHDTDWYFGNANGRAGTNTANDWDWTVPMDLLYQIPSATSGIGKIRTHTYNGTGGNFIGWTETDFGVTVPASVVPTWSSSTIEEQTANVQSIIGAGRYLQGVSRLKSTINGASGAYGSSIVDQAHSVGGEVINGSVADFTQRISVSGTAVPVVQGITDSRGRTKSVTTNINVMPYAPPIVSNFVVSRVNGSNASDPMGTRLKLTITAAVQSIINSTQRNTLSMRAYTKPRSSSTWSAPTNIILGSTTTGYNNVAYLDGPYPVSTAFDIRLEVFDKFNNTPVQSSLATGEIAQHWATGLGIGKYWEQGALDVLGQIYQGAGAMVEPLGVVLPYAGTTAPAGWLLAQGQAVSRTTYAALYALIGNTYGAGNGSSTFNLPDLRGRVIAGVDAGDGDFATAARGGSKTVTLTVEQMPEHNHTGAPSREVPLYYRNDGSGNVGVGQGNNAIGYAAPAGGNQPHPNLQPYIALQYIIRVL